MDHELYQLIICLILCIFIVRNYVQEQQHQSLVPLREVSSMDHNVIISQHHLAQLKATIIRIIIWWICTIM